MLYAECRNDKILQEVGESSLPRFFIQRSWFVINVT